MVSELAGVIDPSIYIETYNENLLVWMRVVL